MNSHKIIKFFIKICILFISLEGFAANYGTSCSGVSIPVDSYLEQNTAYGHIKNSIDIINVPDACTTDDSKITFCLKNKDGTCKTIIMNLDDSKKLSELSTDNNPNLGANPLLANVVLSVKVLNKMFCLTMPTSRGIMPVTCRPTALPPSTSPDEECRYIAKTCYMGTSNSQSLFNFSGLAVDCVKETLDQVFFQHTHCDNSYDKVSLLALNPFSTFQESLKKSIGAALLLYVMFFAIDMILNKKYGNIDKIAGFVINMVLVIYFAVGLGPISFKGGKETQENGMLTYGLPFLSQMTPGLAEIVFNAAGAQGLCKFDTKKYQPGYEFYGLWDSIDCRIAYYLGMGVINNIGKPLQNVSSSTPGLPGTAINITSQNNGNAPEVLRDDTAFKIFTVICGFFMAGNILVVLSGVAFCVIFVSILLQFISTYLVCLITLYVMTYISPIFIPMVLFKRTKAYFDAWLKVCLSCALQPAVMAGFIAILVTLYDSAIYKNCEFARHDYMPNDKNGSIFSTFEIRLPNIDPDKCENSAGYKLLQYYSGQGWEKHLLKFFTTYVIPLDIVFLMVDLLYVFIFSIIFYYFSQSISQFAADITSGPRMDAVTASPTKIVDMVKKGIDFVKDARQGKPPKDVAPDKAQVGRKDNSGDASSGSSAAGDQVSGGHSG